MVSSDFVGLELVKFAPKQQSYLYISEVLAIGMLIEKNP